MLECGAVGQSGGAFLPVDEGVSIDEVSAVR